MKPANIILCERGGEPGVAKVVDFGLVKRIDATEDDALGAVGYYLLTGTPVFKGKTIVEVLAHHLHTRPQPPSERAALAIPGDLERIILECLAKSPEDRPPDARSLERELAVCAARTPWSREQAAGWWTAFRQAQPTALDRTVAEPMRATAEVDLAGRLPGPR